MKHFTVRTEVQSLLSLQPPSQHWLFFYEHPPQPGDEVHGLLTSHPQVHTMFSSYKLSLKYKATLFRLLLVAVTYQLTIRSLSLLLFLHNDFNTCVHNPSNNLDSPFLRIFFSDKFVLIQISISHPPPSHFLHLVMIKDQAYFFSNTTN